MLVGIVTSLFFLSMADMRFDRLTPGDSSLHVAKAASTCSSVYTVRNLSAAAALCLHDFHDTAANLHYYMEDTLPAGSAKTYYLRSLACVPNGFAGTLTVGASQPAWGEVIGLQCGQITGEYFSNKTLSGSPVVVRDDANIDFDWGPASPDPAIPADTFSVRWTMTLSLNAGDYSFHTRTDDGVRLWVDGTLLIDQWHDMAASNYYGSNCLSAGEHIIRVEYYENLGNAVAQFSWSPRHVDTPGLYQNGIWFLRNSNTTGVADTTFWYGGTPGLMAIAGDWNGDRVGGPGFYQQDGSWFLRNSNSTGATDIAFLYGGGAGMVPVAGDWNGDGIDTPGLYQNGIWFLKNSNTGGVADITFWYGGAPNMVPVAGDWNGDGIDTPGLYQNGIWFLRNSNTGGVADTTFWYGGAPGMVPVAGDWNG